MTSFATTARPPRPIAVLSTVSSDSHTWNLVFLQLLLQENGYRVRNLGACVPDDLLVETCRQWRPDLVVLSSVNGHGAVDAERVILRIRAHPELAGVPAVIGGKLDTCGRQGMADRRRRLTEAGFDAVFEESDAIGAFRSFIRRIPAQGQEALTGAPR
jgi:methylaspartate mutase sigma subunit